MVKKTGEIEAPQADAEAEKRKKLKSLAFSRKLLCRAPAKPLVPLEPSKAVQKHQGRDVVKKGQRKNRFLFSFPGLLAPMSGGKVGELADLNTRNPVLYLEFPQGRLKLFGTVVYPKNKYLTLQFSRSSKGVVCEDSFENMILFSEAWWIGRKEDNPEEIRLDFPENFNAGNNSELDFGGGAGSTTRIKSDPNRQAKELTECLMTDIESKDEFSDDSNLASEEKTAKMMGETPVRHSARTAGKSLNYAEPSSEDDSKIGTPDVSEMVDEVHKGGFDIDTPDEEDKDVKTQLRGKHREHRSGSLEKNSFGKRGTLVQATLSTLFEKVAKNSKKVAGSASKLKDETSKKPHTTRQSSKTVKELHESDEDYTS